MTEITYKGANYVAVQTKQTTIVVDPAVSGKKTSKTADRAGVQLMTQSQFGRPATDKQLVFDKPGEYEIGDTSIAGFDAASQLEPTQKSVVFKITATDCSIAVAGHINPDAASDELLEQLGVVDVLIIPVGGNGYTIDPHGAVKLTGRVSPKIVIPVHFKEDGVEYEVPQQSVEEFTKEMGLPVQNEQTLKIKQPGQLPETLTLVQLEKTAG